MPKNSQNKITTYKMPTNDAEREISNQIKEKITIYFSEIQGKIQALPFHFKEKLLSTTKNCFDQLLTSFEQESEIQRCITEVENKKKINLMFEKLYQTWRQNKTFYSQNITSYKACLAEITKEQIRLIHCLLSNIQFYTILISSLYDETDDTAIVDKLKKQQVEFANDLFITIKQTAHFFAPLSSQNDQIKLEETTSEFIHTLLKKIKKHDTWLVNYHDALKKESNHASLKTANVELIRNLISSIQKYNNIVLSIQHKIKNKEKETRQEKNSLASDESLTLGKNTSDTSQSLNLEASTTANSFLSPLPERESVDINILLEIFAKLIQQGRLEILENYQQHCMAYLAENQVQSKKVPLFDKLIEDILAIIDRVKALFSCASSISKTHPLRNGFFFNEIQKGSTFVLDKINKIREHIAFP